MGGALVKGALFQYAGTMLLGAPGKLKVCLVLIYFGSGVGGQELISGRSSLHKDSLA